ncbi:MAG: hypothetical protein BGO47_05810 [Microbacterium sp. 67-17]|uniref:hypothetical protein n=1 Tax=Microbacterium sp. 67-17 TaxID=1895782 RepID=UPI0009615F05|nr:hypothetical protein [Microbacterium sp. 67-17]OJV93451.1 MAG: hypothetical protein BGO47_05810 [Microbacterium sp. 67-17]
MTPTAPVNLQIVINDTMYTVHDSDQEAAALLRLAGRDPRDFDLFLLKKNGVEVKVRDNQIVNLEDGDRFVARQSLRFTIDGETFRSYDDDQEAAALLRLAGLDPAAFDLARVGNPTPFPDDEIVEIVDGDEFVTVKHVGGVA